MDREKAVDLVRKMSKVCGIDMQKSSLMLMPKDHGGIKSKGNQLHVKAQLNFGSRLCLYAVLDEDRLKFKEKPDKIVIIEPPT